MEKINFINNQTPAGATTMNTFQNNIENAINGVVLYDNNGNNYREIPLNDNVDNYN